MQNSEKKRIKVLTDHLKEMSEKVSKFPKWKQEALGVFMEDITDRLEGSNPRSKEKLDLSDGALVMKESLSIRGGSTGGYSKKYTFINKETLEAHDRRKKEALTRKIKDLSPQYSKALKEMESDVLQVVLKELGYIKIEEKT